MSFCLGMLDRVLSRHEGRGLLRRHAPYLGVSTSLLNKKNAPGLPDPYSRTALEIVERSPTKQKNVIFVNSWFRTGSTLVWNLFRDLPGVTSYYEPFNERRWFRDDLRGNKVDISHIGVDDYWKEYEGLQYLDRYFNADWYQKQLYMNEQSWDQDMLAYLGELIHSGDNCVVMQFNRLNFRLAWVRQHFPAARVVHLYRDPRDQWISFIRKPERCPPNITFASLGRQDFFYLRKWGRDLVSVFPMLDESTLEHPYELFYLLWRLSFDQGEHYATHSIALEHLCSNPDEAVSKLFRDLSIDVSNVPKAARKIAGPIIRKNWQQYADNAWFSEIEIRCEFLLGNYYQSRR